MLTYVVIAGLLFCVIMLFMGWRGNYALTGEILFTALVSSLVWPVTIVCTLAYLAGEGLLNMGRGLRCLWEQRRKP